MAILSLVEKQSSIWSKPRLLSLIAELYSKDLGCSLLKGSPCIHPKHFGIVLAEIGLTSLQKKSYIITPWVIKHFCTRWGPGSDINTLQSGKRWQKGKCSEFYQNVWKVFQVKHTERSQNICPW